jgi:exosortase
MMMKYAFRLTPVTRVAALAGASLLFWWHSLIATFRLALSNEAYTHILLILPLSAALIYLKSRDHTSKAPQIDSLSASRIGIAVLFLALFVGCYARWGINAAPEDVRLSLDMFALVSFWIGGILVCLGSGRFRLFLFPLCFLFVLVPIPLFALSWIVEFLQQQSAIAARILFRVIRVPVTQDGNMLYIPRLDIEVARECSSIRSSLMLLVTTMVLAHLFLRSWWRQTLLVAAVVPLAVAKNGLRIVTIAELGTRVDYGYLNGKFHHNGGIIFFGIAVVATVALLWLLRKTEPRHQGLQ